MHPQLTNFAKRHGASVQQGTTYFFEDGASATINYRGSSETFTLVDPPTDPLTLLHARRNFLTAKLKSEIEEFERYKSSQTQQLEWHRQNPSSVPPPHAEAEACLRNGANRIGILKEQLGIIDEQLAKTDPNVIAKRQREEDNRQHQAKISERFGSLTGINY